MRRLYQTLTDFLLIVLDRNMRKMLVVEEASLMLVVASAEKVERLFGPTIRPPRRGRCPRNSVLATSHVIRLVPYQRWLFDLFTLRSRRQRQMMML